MVCTEHVEQYTYMCEGGGGGAEGRGSAAPQATNNKIIS